MSALVLALFAGALAFVWTNGNCHRNTPAKTMRRTIYMCLFWALLKYMADAVDIIEINGGFNTLFTAAQQAMFMQPITALTVTQAITIATAPLAASALLFTRLLLLMFTALCLTALCSPRAVGLALSWYLRPLLGNKAWQPALTIALMAQYLPLVFLYLEQINTAARIRGIPTSGLAYWQYAIPHLFKLLHMRSYAGAMAIASRRLDTPDAWQMHQPLTRGNIICTLAVCAIALMLTYLL